MVQDKLHKVDGHGAGGNSFIGVLAGNSGSLMKILLGDHFEQQSFPTADNLYYTGSLHTVNKTYRIKFNEASRVNFGKY